MEKSIPDVHQRIDVVIVIIDIICVIVVFILTRVISRVALSWSCGGLRGLTHHIQTTQQYLEKDIYSSSQFKGRCFPFRRRTKRLMAMPTA